MPTGMGEDELFAAAVEHGMTTGAPELEIVALLRASGRALGPDPAAKHRAKQRLMALAAQELAPADDSATGPLQVLDPPSAEPVAPLPTALRRSGGRHSVPEQAEDADETATVHRLRPARPETRGHRRAALLGAAAAATLVALAGTSTFASRDALPGDSMYGVKRAAESTGFAFTFGEQAKARKHLEQAGRRLDEVSEIVARGQAAGSEADLVQTTMQQFDTETSQGSQALLAGPRPSAAQVDEVRTWATQQSQRLTAMRSTLPAPDQADRSLAVLNQLIGETAALQGTTTASSSSSSSSTGASAGARSEPAAAPATVRASTGASAHRDPATRSPQPDPTPAPEEKKKAQDKGGDDGGGGGADLNVPLPVPPVNVPSVAGLPSVQLGGG